MFIHVRLLFHPKDPVVVMVVVVVVVVVVAVVVVEEEEEEETTLEMGYVLSGCSSNSDDTRNQ